MAKATAEHRIMVCRRVWLPNGKRFTCHHIAHTSSVHRRLYARTRTDLWCKGGRSAKHTRAAARSRESNVGTFWAGPRKVIRVFRNLELGPANMCYMQQRVCALGAGAAANVAAL